MARPGPIAIFSFCHGSGSGAERVLEYLLTAGIESGLTRDLVVVCPEESSPFLTACSLGYEAIPWPARSPSAFKHDLPAAGRLVPRLANLRPRALHAWHARCFEIAALLAISLKTPLVGTLHDHPTAQGYSRVRRRLMKWGASRMRALVCVSEALAHACRDAHWRTPIWTIPNGLPPAPSDSQKLPRDPFRVAFLGCSEAWKGADTVLALARLLNPSLYQINMYGALTAASADGLRQPLPPGVFLHGRIDPARIYLENDVVLHPSYRFDPFPTVLLEAARAGLPVIATPVGGTREIVTAQTGFFADVGDLAAMKAILETMRTDTTLFQSLSKAARLRFETSFQAARMREGYQKFWQTFVP